MVLDIDREADSSEDIMKTTKEGSQTRSQKNKLLVMLIQFLPILLIILSSSSYLFQSVVFS